MGFRKYVPAWLLTVALTKTGQRVGRSLLVPPLAALLTVAVAHAQYRAGLQGTVTDPSGSVVPGATVTIVDKETNQTQAVQTDAGGTYTFNRLAPAAYNVTVEAGGFAKKTIDNETITGETMQGLNVKLEAGGVSTTVNVTDTTAPAIDTETGNIEGTISARQLQSLPSANRDPYQLLRLAPGTSGDSSQSAGGGSYSQPGNGGIGGSSPTSSIFQVENRPQTQANGVRTSGNSFQVDGSEVNSLAWGGGAVITPNQESVKEIQVQTGPYDATNGRNSGAQVLVVSKNGTNDWHGSAFIKIHRPGLDAFQPYNGPFAKPVRDENRFNQFGGSVGGPVWKNHIFFFFSYETLRNNSSSTGSGWYDTPNYDSLIPAAKPSSIASLVTGFKGSNVVYSSISPTANCASIGLTSAYCHDVSANGITGLDLGSPLPTALGTADPTYVKNGQPGIGGGFDGIPDLFFVNTVSPNQNKSEQYNGRLDWQLNPRDLIAYTIYWVPTASTSYNGPVRALNLYHSDHLSYSHAALWNHTFNPSLLNEFRLNAVRWYFNEVATNPQEPFGLPRGNIDNIGSANLGTPFGPPGPGDFAQTTYNLRDTVTKTLGSQNVRVGFDGYRELDNDTQTYAAIPSYSFRNLWDYANDAPYQESGNFDPRTGAPTSATKYIRSSIYAGFVQDDWRIKPNLTLNLGLRCEYFTPIREKNNNLSNTVLGAGTAALTDVRLKVGGDLYSTSHNNWGPQVGFAWTPHPTAEKLLVVRGGAGIGYNRMQEAITLNGRSNPPLVTGLSAVCTDLAQTNCPGIFYAPSSSPTNLNGYPVNPAAKVVFGPNGLPTSGAQIQINGLPQNLATPVTYRFSLGGEYALTSTWVASLGYQGSISKHYTRQNNLNWIYYPNLNPIINGFNYFSNDVNGNANAMLAEIKHNFARAFSIDAQYKWSKVLDEGSQDYYEDQYPYTTKAAYGPADFDMRHNFKIFGSWQPRFFPNNRALEGVFGGWQVSGIYQWHTGYPWTPIYGATNGNVVYVGSGYRNLRPGSWNGQGNTDRSNQAFVHQGRQFPGGALNYFTVPAYPTTGAPPPPGVARNVLRSPRYIDTDMDLQKTFGFPHFGVFRESTGLTIRAMFFNIFNNLNLTPFNTGDTNTQISTDGLTSNPLFGQSSGALGGRTLEFQARFSF